MCTLYIVHATCHMPKEKLNTNQAENLNISIDHHFERNFFFVYYLQYLRKESFQYISYKLLKKRDWRVDAFYF